MFRRRVSSLIGPDGAVICVCVSADVWSTSSSTRLTSCAIIIALSPLLSASEATIDQCANDASGNVECEHAGDQHERGAQAQLRRVWNATRLREEIIGVHGQCLAARLKWIEAEPIAPVAARRSCREKQRGGFRDDATG